MTTISRKKLARPLKRVGRAIQLAALKRVDPLEAARLTHRETRHARNRRFLKEYVAPGGIGAEVGVFWAHFSEVLLREFKPARLYLVDPWDLLHGETFRFISPYTLDGKLTTATAMARAQRLARRHPRKVSVERCFSVDFFNGFEDAHFDWVYLDAAHTYPEVKADLAAIWPKLKPGGVLLGDDYYVRKDGSDNGTKSVVDEFVEQNGLELITERRPQFVIHKPG